MAKRSTKWYFKNEDEVMKRFGFKPTPQSGAGWIHKEDGENEFFLAQLKSTEAESYRLSRVDMDKLEYHAMVNHKIPVFITQFIGDGNIYVTLNASNIESFIEYWKTGKKFTDDAFEVFDENMKSNTLPDRKTIKSSGREKYNRTIAKEKEKKYGKDNHTFYKTLANKRK